MAAVTEDTSAGTGSARDFTVLDWLGTIGAGAISAGLLLFPIVGSSFAPIFRDLMASHRIPALTRLAISTWFPMLLGLLVAAGVLVGTRRAVSLRTRRALVVGAFVFGAVGLGLCIVALYLPMFSVAGAVKAD